LIFTLDDEGRLDWLGLGNTMRPDLSLEEAQLVALAEAALHEVADAIKAELCSSRT
jgi:hypothetical protein